MATTIGKLKIILTANAGRFQKAMRRSRKSLATVSKSAARFALKIGGIGTALAGLVAGGGFIALLRNAALATDRLAKTADKLGLTTEALAGMRFAAKLTGVDIRKMEMGLQRMTRRVSEAAKDTGEAKDAIKELGLDAKFLNTLSPDKMFREIAKAMSAVGTQGDRVRLAFKLFDSEGVDLVNTLALGGKELDRLIEKTRTLGTGINRIDAKKIEMMNDSFVRMREAVSGLSTQILVQLTPYVEGLSTAFFNAGTDGIEMAKVVNKSFTKLATGIIEVVSTLDVVFSGFLGELEIRFRKSINNIFTLITGIVALPLPGIGLAAGALKPFEDFFRTNAKELKSLRKGIEGMEDEIFDAYLAIINNIGDRLFEFDRRAREAVERTMGRIDPAAFGRGAGAGGTGGAAGATIRGRSGKQGLIRAGGILGAQKVADQQGQIARNTAATVTAINQLKRLMSPAVGNWWNMAP